MDYRKIMGALDQINGLLETQTQGNEVSEETLIPLITELYNGIVGKYRPVLGAIPLVIDNVSNDLAPLISAMIKCANTLCSNPRVQEESKKLKQIFAQNKAETLQIYMEAGFSREESLALILQDMEVMRQAVSNFSKSSPVTLSSH